MDYADERKQPISEKVENRDEPKNEEKVNTFDRLMFGSKDTANQILEGKHSNDTELLSGVNLDELMGHIDSLMNSAQELKPMFKNIQPLINNFLKK